MYDLNPAIKIDEKCMLFTGTKGILEAISDKKKVIIETYPGVDVAAIKAAIPATYEVIDFGSVFMDNEKINEIIFDVITEDRVFGKMNEYIATDFIVDAEFIKLQEKFNSADNIVVIGFGSSLLENAEVSILVDITRWEIQLRYRKGLCNLFVDNQSEDNIRKFKRGYFFDWRVADRLKFAKMGSFDFIFDDTDEELLGLSHDDYFKALNKFYAQPFRLEPYFDPGVWGGNWMKEKCSLPENGSNYAWCFDGVVEENSLNIQVNGRNFNIPAINLLYNNPINFVGENVVNKFGIEYPIRFDFLDTINGQNLSLQVHPTPDYIKKEFNMNYTQEESYYILDAVEGATVYLGVKNDLDKDAFKASLESGKFADEQFVNQFPAKKHDHFLIPSGTIHCSGSGTMVLEVSTTPYIFTFKMWDWDRLGMDGIPRPTHISRGLENIKYEHNEDFARKNLINHFEVISEVEEKTGLYDTQLLEVRRYKAKDKVVHNTSGTVHQLNLIEGNACLVTSPTGAFAPYEVSYAETFIIPAAVGEYVIEPLNCDEVMYLKAYVR